MFFEENNNFQLSSIYELDKEKRNIKSNTKVIIDVSGTKYDLVRQIANKFDWFQQEQKNDQNKYHIWNLKWYDFYINEDDLKRILPYQKINHFPCSVSLGKKSNLGKHLNKLQKVFPNDYDFFPKTWLLPYQYEDLKSFMINKELKKSQKTMISKPEASCQDKINPDNHQVVQQYIQNPLLIDGLKFDCRLYVLIKNINPLKIFLYKDGLARFSTEKYAAPKVINIAIT